MTITTTAARRTRALSPSAVAWPASSIEFGSAVMRDKSVFRPDYNSNVIPNAAHVGVRRAGRAAKQAGPPRGVPR